VVKLSLDITPLAPKGQQTIQSYGDGGFRISNAEHNGSVIVFLDKCVLWECKSVDEIDENSFQSVREAKIKPEIIVIGCGETFTRPPQQLIDYFKSHSIVMEWMATGAACRTYNVLALEGRGVAAALVAID